MDIKIEFAFEVVRPEFSKMGFVPDDDIRMANPMEAGPAGEEGVDNGGDVLLVLEQEFFLRREAVSTVKVEQDENGDVQ